MSIGKFRFYLAESIDDNIVNSAKIEEEYLTEDKVVKFGGETFPSYGWCVILCGGAGSGKSTAADLLVPINARKYDVDILKSEKFYKIKSDGYDHILTFIDGEQHNLEKEGLHEPFNMTNPEFTTWLHNNRRKVASRLKKSIFDAGRDSSEDRLPNILFDITGKDFEDFESIISEVKEIGYKVAIVWVLAEIQQAISQNESRPRKLPRDMLIGIHRDVLNTIEHITLDSKMLSNIDDFWVILQTVFDVTDKDDVQRYIKLPNVFKIEKQSDAFKIPDEIKNAVEKQKNEIIKLLDSENT